MSQPAAALIGDLVGSRDSADRAALQAALRAALTRVNSALPAAQPLTVTIGDEFQAVYEGVASATFASLLVRLLLAETVDVRFGIGVGSFTIFETGQHPQSQDGPAWWAARDAITEVHAGERRKSHTRTTRTRCSALDKDEQANVVLLNSFLITRDSLVATLSPRAAAATAAWMLGSKLSDISDQLQVSISAVSQLLSRGGYALADAQASLEELTP